MAAPPRKRPAPKRPPRPSARPATSRVEEETEKRDSSPEIEVAFAAAGRQTLAAIAEDLVPPEPEPQRVPTPPRDVELSAPDLEFKLVPAGRETLAAITLEVGPLRRAVERVKPKHDHAPEEPKTGVRPRLRTRGYSEPPPPVEARMTTPGLAPPPNTMPSAVAKPTTPEKLSRDTLDAIEKAVLEPVPSSRRAAGVQLDVFELMTFVVRGDDLAQLSSEATRREFVAERVLHRLPVATMDQVDRIDVTPWTVSGTLILRVWCRVKAKR